MSISEKHKKRATEIMEELGGTATTEAIAQKADRSTNGVAQTLGSMDNVEEIEGGRGGLRKWRLVAQP